MTGEVRGYTCASARARRNKSRNRFLARPYIFMTTVGLELQTHFKHTQLQWQDSNEHFEGFVVTSCSRPAFVPPAIFISAS